MSSQLNSGSPLAVKLGSSDNSTISVEASSSSKDSLITLTSLSWNIEGVKRNLYSLKRVTSLIKPNLIFISEPQLFISDLTNCMSLFRGEYYCELNSEDKFDPEIAMLKTHAKGGTMVMWQVSLDSFIQIHPVHTSSFLPVVYSPPGCPVSVHIALYMPTSGKETDFLEELSSLGACLDELSEKYKDCLFFIRGDANVNKNNKDRMRIFQNFLSSHSLTQVPTSHNTYHHFLGGGSFDSDIDVIIHSVTCPNYESIAEIICRNESPDLESHHDIIVSKVSLPFSELKTDLQTLLEAPKIEHARQKIMWSEEGIARYEEVLSTKLSEIRLKWLNPTSRSSLAVLLATTSNVMNRVACDTNKHTNLNAVTKLLPVKVPAEVRRSETNLKILQKSVKLENKYSEGWRAAQESLKQAKIQHRALTRKYRHSKEIHQNEVFFSILSSKPSSAFSAIRAAKRTRTAQVPFVTVGEKEYSGERVIDGLYESILKLKTLDSEQLSTSTHHSNLNEDYENIKLLCSHKIDLPQIQFKTSSSILFRIKPNVNDFFSITSRHFINAGTSGLVHFNLLMNAFILNINNCTIAELNTVYALLLYKGHNKDRTLDSSYRTISTCPLVAKGLDMYVRDIFLSKWNKVQAKTQYQGEGSSHELASLIITEATQYSMHRSKEQLFLLFLDAKSAFDNVVTPYLIRQAYLSGMEGNSILYLDNRLSHRKTYLEYNKATAGPILDECGLEQGGVSSSDLYKLYNNEQLSIAQDSRLGVALGDGLVLSAVGQADDAALISNDIGKLNLILKLVLNYCQKFSINLSDSKTKLLALTPARQSSLVPYNPIRINDKQIDIVDQAEHVGVIRSTQGNMPNLLQRITAFKKALGSIISCGLARGSRSNPVASLRILSIYGTPVLMSGLSSLYLSPKEISCIEQQYKKAIQNIMKISAKSPASLVYFVAGSLPGSAILHMRQISLFGMICRLKGDPLNQLASYILLTSSYSEKSWFVQIRNLLLQYDLPHPLKLLDDPPDKLTLAKLVKAKVLDFWERKLRQEALLLPSLVYLNTHFQSLCRPHKLWSTAGHKSYEVSKARIQLLFLSSQYPCGSRTRHWSHDNPQGYCSYISCKNDFVVETPEHILLQCPAYNTTRNRMVNLCLQTKQPATHSIIVSHFLHDSNQTILQLILDCSSLPDVISSAQIHGDYIFSDLFYLGRTWCYAIHRARSKRLGLWHVK